MVLKVLVFLCALRCALLQTDCKGTKFEPIQFIKAQVPDVDHSSIWTAFREFDAKQAGTMTSLLMKGLRKYQTENPQTSIILSKGQRVINKRLSPGTLWTTPYQFPYSNSLALLSIGMEILLEGYNPDTIHGPMGEALEGKEKENSLFDGYKEKSLFNVLTNLTTTLDEDVLKNSDLLDELNDNGKVVLSFVNSVLGKTKSEAWTDALFALGIEKFSIIDSGQLKISLEHVFHYALSVIQELRSKATCSPDSLPYVDQRFLFGWWINCPRDLDVCMFPELPADLVLSVSPSLRLYICPSLELSMIVYNSKTTQTKSLSDVVHADKGIWTKIRASLEVSVHQSDPIEKPVIAAESENLVIRLVIMFYPFFSFVFWVGATHVCVYWGFHIIWFVIKLTSKNIHESRPKTAVKTD